MRITGITNDTHAGGHTGLHAGHGIFNHHRPVRLMTHLRRCKQEQVRRRFALGHHRCTEHRLSKVMVKPRAPQHMRQIVRLAGGADAPRNILSLDPRNYVGDTGNGGHGLVYGFVHSLPGPLYPRAGDGFPDFIFNDGDR